VADAGTGWATGVEWFVERIDSVTAAQPGDIATSLPRTATAWIALPRPSERNYCGIQGTCNRPGRPGDTEL